MASSPVPDQPAASPVLRLHHGTDLNSGNDLLRHGVDQAHAAAWNGSGEFWTTTSHSRAEWFARSHPSSPPAVCFEFDVPVAVVQQILGMRPPGVVRHATGDYEFSPACYTLLNQHMANVQVVQVP